LSGALSSSANDVIHGRDRRVAAVAVLARDAQAVPDAPVLRDEPLAEERHAASAAERVPDGTSVVAQPPVAPPAVDVLRASAQVLRAIPVPDAASLHFPALRDAPRVPVLHWDAAQNWTNAKRHYWLALAHGRVRWPPHEQASYAAPPLLQASARCARLQRPHL
jgi:hypothetical protein